MFWVRMPIPGPTSKIEQILLVFKQSTIFFATSELLRKCCPNFFFGFTRELDFFKACIVYQNFGNFN